MPDERTTYAWVVRWIAADGRTHERARSYERLADAEDAADDVRAAGIGTEVTLTSEPDLAPEGLSPAFVARMGVETRPGRVLVDREHAGPVEVRVTHEVLLALAHQQEDVADDRDLDVVPRVPHPRRTGLARLVADVQDRVDALDPDVTVLRVE
ncbi:hypothetical protein AB0N29_17585 [Nocardioides sp. NPDC092400]|uniref:hypothetical protein n=1 Tax=Nocardioides sp. NPDC092400 TaxID=3155196 RepID=UPI003421E0DC